ncbi:MAG: hypothetical protein ACD_41C00315G0006 [uncultured bacterium]|nr:MAG: hypothetical protein ACD_41C00315G0006 [uncultured bacterium]HBY74074.1 hypothetical protein [Candidatus Kerfeldbacteria bacterium]
MKRSDNLLANHLWQIYQDIGEVKGSDAQKLFREALDGLYHQEAVSGMMETVDGSLADAQQDKELSQMLDDFVETGIDAEAILANLSPLCRRDGFKSVSQILRVYLDQQKQLLQEVPSTAEREQFDRRFRSLMDRTNRYFGAELRVKAEQTMRRGMTFDHGEA